MTPGKLYRLYDKTEPIEDVFLAYGTLKTVINLEQGAVVMYIAKVPHPKHKYGGFYYCLLYKNQKIYVGEYWKMEFHSCP